MRDGKTTGHHRGICDEKHEILFQMTVERPPSRDQLPHQLGLLWPRMEKPFTFLKTWRPQRHSGFYVVIVLLQKQCILPIKIY